MRTGIKVDSQKGSEILLKIYNNTTPSTNTKPQRVPSSNPTTKAFLLQNPKPKNSTVMSTPLVPDAYVLASLMESHFKELDLIPELFLLNNEEMLFILEKCFSHSCLEKAIAEKIAVDKSDSADQINPSPVDSALLKDCVAQVRVASKKRFIKIVHCYLLKAGKEKEAQEYLEKVSPASRVDHLESVKMWNYLTLPFQVLKVMEDMGLGTSPLSFSMPPAPPEVFPTPARGWRPGQATAPGNIPLPRIRGLIDSYVSILLQDEAGIVPETEDRPSTAVEPNSVGLVLHVGEVTDRSMMDAAAEDKKKKKKGVDGSGVSSGKD